MSSRERTRWAFGLALIASCVAIFFATCERRTIELPGGYQDEARANRYLAAQRMLAAMGTEVRGIDGLDELVGQPPLDGTLILPTQRNTISRERSDELRDWTERGGHLIVLTWTVWDEKDRQEDYLLDALDVRQFMHPSAAEQEREEDGDDEEPVDEPDYGALALAPFPDREEPLEAEFDPLFRLERPGGEVSWSMGDSNGVHLMQLPLGQGLLTVMTDDYILANDTIGAHDHAELSYRLVRSAKHTGPVWIVYSEAYASAWSLLWKHAWMVLVSAVLLLAAWIWHVSRRFGPQQPDDPLERRRLMEHVEAAGRFQWRQGEGQALLDGMRESLLERVRERHPGWVGLAPAGLNQRLAELAGLPRETVARALAFRSDTGRDPFARNIATLERIRKAL